MPHVTLEYSANINDFNSQELFSQIHEILGQIADVAKCQSRAIRQQDFYIDHGRDEDAFVLLRIELKSGRAEEVRQNIGQQCHACLVDFFAPIITSNGLNCEPAVEVNELGLYIK